MWKKQVNGMGNGMGKIKVCSLVLGVLLIVMLVSVVSADENGITFVLGTDENRASLLNASGNVSVNIEIYNATQACSMDFANESVVFLASLDNETVACINSTINSSAYICAYNLSSDINIANMDDPVITDYWETGGDENIRDLIEYINSKVHDSVPSSEDTTNAPHLDIAIVTGYRSHELPLKHISEKINNDINLNMTLNYYLYDYVMENDVNLSSMDIIYIKMLTPATASRINETVTYAICNGSVVIDDDTLLDENIPLPEDEIEDYRDLLNTYWTNGAYNESNLENLVYRIAYDFFNRTDLVVGEPIPLPPRAIYHPNMSSTDPKYFCEDLNTYLGWYANRTDGGHVYDPDSPTVAITFYKSYFPYQIEPIDALIHKFEFNNINVIPFYATSKNSGSVYLRLGNETIVDAIVSFTYFSNKFNAEEIGVPVINGVINNYMNCSEWENSSHPLPTDKMLKIDNPELVGTIDPIIMAATEKDVATNTDRPISIDYQVEWLVNRTIAQINLAVKPESEKRVAIIYYNHGGGKDNIGASYLDVAPSICSLLEEMDNANYSMDTSLIPNKTALIDLMLTQGINVGTWAPGELKKLVDTKKITLIPESTYKQWFEQLPVQRQEEVISRWGPVPGEIMVYENESGKYLVIPKIDVGNNVLLAPQPTRGWLQDNDVLYHDKELAPHHQYIAFYLWLQNEYNADAIVHFGRHGTQEWLPGKQFGLSRYDWPSIMVGDMPVIYPYVMDGLGEGNQAKRRGNAVIIDHLVPPIIAAGSYGNYSNLSEAIFDYEQAKANPTLKAMHKAEILNLTRELHLDEQMNMSLAENQTTFEDVFLEELSEYLEELKSTSMPYGLHILGTTHEDEKLVGMVNSMLGAEFAEEVYQFNNSDDAPLLLLDLVLNRNVNITAAQMQVLQNTSTEIDNYLSTSLTYAQDIAESLNEIQQVLNALDGRFIPANLGGDPVRTPYALPSGRNFYAFDQRTLPKKAAWELGKIMADDMLDAYRASHNGTYPRKVAYVLWAGETTRHEGVMESQILYLLGIEPDWEKNKVIGVKLPSEPLDRPRIDVVIVVSGLYRDMFPSKIVLLDEAVRLAYAQNNTSTCPNYVKQNADALAAVLMENDPSLDPDAALDLALLRIFGCADGTYGPGLSNAIGASNTWNDTDVLAQLFIDRMGNAYGSDVWGESATDLFKTNLADVEVTMHSRSSNLYGGFDNDDFFQYLGGLNLAVSFASGGDYPDSYVTNLRANGDERVETLSLFLSKELYSRYFNPKWIAGMQEHGYAGAREMVDFVENLWGWEVTDPNLIKDHVWMQVYQTYIENPENREWLMQNNPYGYQALAARMLEATRKLDREGNPYWNADQPVINALVREYVESVAENGVTCCHHTCGNPLLDEYISGKLSVVGLSAKDIEKYRQLMDEATGLQTEQSVTKTSNDDSSSLRLNVSGTGNESTDAGSGAGLDAELIQDAGVGGEGVSDPGDYVEGFEMQDESAQTSDAGPMPFSGADIVGMLLVMLAAGAIYIGFRRRGV